MSDAYRKQPMPEFKVITVRWDAGKHWAIDLETTLNKYASAGYDLHTMTDSGGAFTLVLRKYS